MELLKKKKQRSEPKNEESEERQKKAKLEEEPKKQETQFTSLEGYKDKRILDLVNIPEFDSSDKLEPPSSNLSMFETKELAEKYFKENKYNIEDILNYDNTNKEIQKNYLIIAVKILNTNPEIKVQNVVIEKIKKCGIILDKIEYEEEIKKLKDENFQKKLAYIDYKSSIIDTLEYIQNNKNGSVDKALEKLNIKNLLNFNHESNIGNNNYYFYGLARQIANKLEEIFNRHSLYLYIIKKNLEYLKKDFSKLSKQDKYIFKYISFILTDPNSITVTSTVKEIQNFLEGKPIDDINKLEKAIEERNNKESENDPEFKNNINYNIMLNNEFIEYIINEETKIDRKEYSETHIKKYKYNIFNDNIIELIKTISLENFESEIFENILPKQEYSFSFYEKTKSKIFDIVSRILKSKAAKDFFEEIYKNKYDKNNKKIEYHFDRDKVLEKIFERIEFYPIFNPDTKANTSPTDLTIIVNSIPGKFSKKDEINYFNKKILQVGRLVIFIVHEIFGHILRRYYSYLTNGIIKMETGDDDNINTKPESGFFVERKFLGFKSESRLYLKDALFLLYDENNFEKYPIIKEGKNLNEDDLKIIIKNNKALFDFIKKESEVKDEKEDKNKNKKQIDSKKIKKKNKITLEQYYNYLNPEKRKFPSIISCGVRLGESYIEL